MMMMMGAGLKYCIVCWWIVSDPRISSERLKSMMEGRRLIQLSHIHQKTRSIDMEGDWVTMAVIVSKTDPKVSAKVGITVGIA